LPSARQGDPVRHRSGVEPIAQGSDSVRTNGLPTSRKDDLVSCADPILEGSPNVNIGAPTGVACSICPNGMAVGNPVNPMLGAKVQGGETDLFLPGPLPFALSRDYSSYQTDTPAPIGLLGPGWRLPAETSVLQSGEQLTLNDTKGRSIRFEALAPGEVSYSRSEGLWLVRGGASRLNNSPLALAWQAIPEALRLHAGCIFIANTPLGPWWIHGPSDLSFDDQPSAKQPKQAKAPAPDIEGQRLLLQGQIDRFGHTLRYTRSEDKKWQQAITGVQDGAGRRYRLELIKLPRIATDKGRQGWGSDSGIRLAAVYLTHDPGHGGLSAAVVRYEYTPRGELAAVHGRDGTQARRFDYHPQLTGRMVAHAWPGREAISRYEYNDDGRVSLQTNPGALDYRFEYQKDATVVTDSLGRKQTYHFKGEGGLRRAVRIEQSDGSAIANEYNANGQLISTTDELGRQTRYLINPVNGNLLTLTAPGGQRHDFEYDRHGNLSSVRSGGQVRESRQYDNLGRLTVQTNALGQSTHYRYSDKQSQQPSEIEDAKGGVKKLQWNQAGQITSYSDC